METTSSSMEGVIDSSTEMADISRGGTDGFTSASGVLGAILATGSSCSADEPDAIIEIFFRDNVPYTRIEKRATHNFNSLHPNSKISNKQTYFNADTKETYDVALELFGNKSREQILEELEVLESVLTYEKEQKDKAKRVLEKV